MAQRKERLVVVMLDHIPRGEKFEIWDRHITIVPWFPCDDESRLDQVLVRVSSRHQKIIVKAGGLEKWGKKEKYPVQLVDDGGGLKALHQDVFDSLESSGFSIHQKDFMGQKYTPHIALRNRLQRGKALKSGEAIKISRFTLVGQDRLKGSGRMIKTLMKDYELG